MSLSNLFKSFLKTDKATVSVELGVAMPVLMVILAGMVETGNFILLNLKLQHTTIAMADLATRDDEISDQVIEDIFSAVPQIMTPYSDPTKFAVILSAVSQTEDVSASVFWQRRGGSLIGNASFVGNEGDSPNLPGVLSLDDDETIIIAETFYEYEPLIFEVIGEQIITKTSFFRPRIGSLQAIS